MRRVSFCVLLLALLFSAACGGSKKSQGDIKISDGANGDGLVPDGNDEDALEPDGLGSEDAVDDSVSSIPCLGSSGELIPNACPPTDFCNKDGLCERKKEVGAICDGRVNAALTDDAACKVGYCKPGPFSSSKYCVNVKETCADAGDPVPVGGFACSQDGKSARECGPDGTWKDVVECLDQSCSGGEGRVPVSCQGDVGCKSSPECISCAPGRFDDKTGQCATSCSKTADCGNNAECDNGTCRVADKKGPGQGCVAVDECKAGLFCVRALDPTGAPIYATNETKTPSRVCCSEDCDATCRGCLPDGKCSAVVKGKTDRSCVYVDPKGSVDFNACSFNGTCDGQGNCDRWPEGTPCSDSSCSCDGGTCKETAPSKCDAQHQCNPSSQQTTCPEGKGCKDNQHCDFGSCTDHASCPQTSLFCDTSKTCRLRLAAFEPCYGQSYDAGAPYDDAVCGDGLACLKDNFSATDKGRCGVIDQCIAANGQEQLPADTIRCGGDGVPRQCKLVSGRAEWSTLSACNTATKGCELDTGTPNSGVQQGEVCVDNAGCQPSTCNACPKNTKFDPQTSACLAQCGGDADCRPGYRCDLATKACVKAGKPGDECQPDPQQIGYKPCLATYEGKALYCSLGNSGKRVCCFEDCNVACRYCNDLAWKTVPVYTCGNYNLGTPSAGCNKTSGAICEQQTGFCDGQGACELRGGTSECAQTCTSGSLTKTYCDGKGHCNQVGSPTPCPGGVCRDATTCESSCKSHAECPGTHYCSKDGICQPKLNNGQRCDGATIEGTSNPFDNAACGSTSGCYKTPTANKGYCTATGNCVISDANTVKQNEFYCVPASNLVYACKSGGVWQSAACNQNDFASCGNDSNGDPNAYKPPATCNKTAGCTVSSSCTVCPNHLLYVSPPQTGVQIPCYAYCHCVPSTDGLVSDPDCPAGWVKDVQDSRCQDDRWCGKDPLDSNSSYQCRLQLEPGNRCSDTIKPTRQCESGSQCCKEILANGGLGNPYCSTCCSDDECAEQGQDGYCDVKNGGCAPTKDLGQTCSRGEECSSGKCCNDTCSQCCSNSDCLDPNKPACLDGTCQAKKPGGSSCQDGNECLSGVCSNGYCTCSIDGHCAQTQYCLNGSCLNKKSGGKVCTASNQCLSGNCCSSQNRCANDCCVDADCGSKWCDNAAKTTYKQPNDGKTYSCQDKRKRLDGCSDPVQCETAICNTNGAFCGMCKEAADCDKYKDTLCATDPNCTLVCCGNVCAVQPKIDPGPIPGEITPTACPVCTVGTIACGLQCCGAGQYCTARGCQWKQYTGAKCDHYDQACYSGSCNRELQTCD